MEHKKKKKDDLACKKRGNYQACDCSASLGITFLQINSSVQGYEWFSSFEIAIKIPQHVHFTFSAPLQQKSELIQPNPQVQVKDGVSTGELLTSADTARVTSNAKQQGPEEDKVAPESSPLQLR